MSQYVGRPDTAARLMLRRWQRTPPLWRPPEPSRPVATYTIVSLARIPLDPPLAFTAPADATDAELERAAVDALLARP